MNINYVQFCTHDGSPAVCVRRSGKHVTARMPGKAEHRVKNDDAGLSNLALQLFERCEGRPAPDDMDERRAQVGPYLTVLLGLRRLD